MRTRLSKALPSVLIGAFVYTTTVQPLLSASNTPEALQKPEEGYLLLETSHSGLTVTIDGAAVGASPLPILRLAPGVHRVEVAHPARINWLDRDWFQNVTIAPGDTVTVSVVFELSYSIRSKPQGASVVIDQEEIGETPLFFRLFENERTYATLSKPGFADTTFVIGNHGPTKQRFFDVRLKERDSRRNVSPAAIHSERRNGSNSTLLLSAAGLAVVSGALALYLRGEANKRFDQYRSTGQPDKLERFFNEAQDYDRVATVSFAVFQVSLIASFYLFLKDVNR